MFLKALEACGRSPRQASGWPLIRYLRHNPANTAVRALIAVGLLWLVNSCSAFSGWRVESAEKNARSWPIGGLTAIDWACEQRFRASLALQPSLLGRQGSTEYAIWWQFSRPFFDFPSEAKGGIHSAATKGTPDAPLARTAAIRLASLELSRDRLIQLVLSTPTFLHRHLPENEQERRNTAQSKKQRRRRNGRSKSNCAKSPANRGKKQATSVTFWGVTSSSFRLCLFPTLPRPRYAVT